jgi:hypothetical protein
VETTHATREASREPIAKSTDREKLRQRFVEDGYLVFKNVVSPDKLSHLGAKLNDEFDRAKQAGSLFSGGGIISGHLNSFPGEDSRFVYEALREHGILDLIKACFPNSPSVLDVRCNLNLPNSVAQHYHIDGRFSESFMVANVAVVDTDLVNGAIDILPATHKQFYPYWRFVSERLHRLTTRIPMSRGDVLLRTSSLWHRGMPNRAPVPRPMLGLTFGDPAIARSLVEGGVDIEARDPFRVNDGKIAFYENWYRSNWLGRLRERTFVAAPVTYSAYRVVTSLFGNKGY